MKSTISRDENKEEGLSYPVLMECVSDNSVNGIVVLFTSIASGVVVYSKEENCWQAGHYATNWVPCDDKSDWRKFTGKITLSN